MYYSIQMKMSTKTWLGQVFVFTWFAPHTETPLPALEASRLCLGWQKYIKLTAKKILLVKQVGFERDEGKVSIHCMGVLRDMELIPHSHSLYIRKVGISYPYPGDGRCLVPGQKSDALFWQWQWDKGVYPARAAIPTLGLGIFALDANLSTLVHYPVH